MPSQQLWLKTLGFLVIVQQSAYWGYRMGQDECLFKECIPPNEVLDTASRLAGRTLESESSSSTTVKVKRGIVLTSQCSGSEWIVSSLNNVPGVTWHLERMIRYSRTYMKDPEWEKITWQTYHADLEKAFTIIPGVEDPEVTPQNNKPPTMIGFKLMYDQIPQHLRLQFAQWLEEHQVFVVHLRRKCAALQWSSQMDKFMRLHRQKIRKDHVYSKAEADALASTKDWEITLQDNPRNVQNRWLESIRLLEENQQDFANYLHIYAAQAPVFDFTYESVDGPFQANWFNALYAFLGLHHYQYQGTSKTIKTGKRTCEDRMSGLGGPALPLLKETPQSRVECLRMRSLAAAVTGNLTTTTSGAALSELGLKDLMLPPSHGDVDWVPIVVNENTVSIKMSC